MGPLDGLWNSTFAGGKRHFTRLIALNDWTDGRLVGLRRQGVIYIERTASGRLLVRMELCCDAVRPGAQAHAGTHEPT